MGEAMDPSIHKMVPRLMCFCFHDPWENFISQSGSIKVLSHWSEDREGLSKMKCHRRIAEPARAVETGKLKYGANSLKEKRWLLAGRVA